MKEQKNRIIYQSSILILVVFVVLSAILLYLPMKALRKNTIQALNQEHIILAQQTAFSINELFGFYESIINNLIQDPDIIALNPAGKQKIRAFYKAHKETMSAVTLIDKKYIIRYTYPSNDSIIGSDVSFRPHLRLAFDLREPAVSDIIQALRGYNSVVYTVPILDSQNQVQGLLNVLIPFEIISRKYLENLRPGSDSQIWLISGNGDVLYSSHKEHISQSVFEVHSNDITMVDMSKHMTNAESGNTVLRIKENDYIRMQTIYYPVNIPQNLWSLAIATPEPIALKGVNQFILWWLSIFFVFLSILLYIVIKWVGKYVSTLEEKKRMETENRLRETESLLSRFIFNAPIPIIMARTDGSIEYINQHFQQMYGYTQEDIKDIFSWIDQAYPDQEAKDKAKKFWQTDLQRALTEKQAFVTKEKVLKSKDGTSRDIIITFTLIEDRIVISLDDRTTFNSLKNKEQEILFKKARAKKMEAIGLMAGGVAHDLNNILSGIVSYPDLLLLQLPSNSELRKPIEIIQKSGIRAAQVVSDLLTVARGVASPRQAAWINDIIHEFLNSPEMEILRNTHPDVRVEAYLLSDDDQKFIQCSRIHIKKSIMNLLFNAAEAMESGGRIRISSSYATLDEDEIQDEKLTSGEYIVLSVEDDGKGISAEDQEHIFEPFYTKKKMGKSGTGLGLSIVWNTVQDHNGIIKLKSDTNGTRFDLYFPVSHQEKILVKSSGHSENVKGNGEKILIVDDEETQLEITSQILKQMNYTPYTAGSGEEALEFLKEHQVDLVLLDMIMGEGLNGRETYEKMIKKRPGLKAIIVSGYAHNTEVDQALKLGVNAYVAKPYSIHQLTQVIRDILDS